jgi:histidinol-phosphate aminotransferase
LQHEEKIRDRLAQARVWTAQLGQELRALGVRTFPTETSFFLADFAPHDATTLAEELPERGILSKPLNDPHLAHGQRRGDEDPIGAAHCKTRDQVELPLTFLV